MLTPRFQLPDPDKSPDDLSNQTLILRCMQDPLHVVIKEPSLREQELLLNHVGAQLHPGALGMMIQALRDETPLDRALLSAVAETAKVSIEDATSLVWNEGEPEITRYIVISALSTDKEVAEDADHQFAGDRLQLTIDRTVEGKIELSLGWENGDCAESLEALNDRWTKMNAVYKSLGRDPLPWDLLPLAEARGPSSHDDTYNFQGLSLVAYPMDPDVIVDELSIEERALRDEARETGDEMESAGTDDERDDEFGLFEGVDTGEAPDQDDPPMGEHAATTDLAENDESLTMPGDDIIIIAPTAKQLTAIAKLSSMPVTQDLVVKLMRMTTEGAPISAKRFELIDAKVRERLCVHKRATYVLNRSLSESHRYSLDEVDLNKPTMFCMNLSFHKPESPSEPGVLKSVLHWEHFSPECDVPNWDRIIEIARRRG